jgi:cysteine synthase
MLKNNIIDCVGLTPLVALGQAHREQETMHGTCYAKLELMNPFGMKDRVARHILLEARRRGELQDGMPIIESSSGTMALGLALVGSFLGHEVHIVTDPRMDRIVLTKLRALGCHVHFVSAMTSHGWQSARLERLAELLREYPNAFWPRQYENPDNPGAYTALAHELLQDLARVDVLVGSVGSGGSLCGTARALLKVNPRLRVVAVDAVGSAIFGQPDSPQRLQSGLGNSLVPLNVDRSVIHEVHWLNDSEAFCGTLQLAAEEKIFAGNSSGSAYVVARWIASMVSPDTKIVAIFPDRGDRYVNTFYNEEYRQQKGLDQLVIPTAPQEVPFGSIVTSWSFARLIVGGDDTKIHT